MYAKGSTQEADVELAAVRFVCELFSRNRHLSEGPIAVEAAPEQLQAIADQGIPAQGRPLDEVVAEMQENIIATATTSTTLASWALFPVPSTRCRGWAT